MAVKEDTGKLFAINDLPVTILDQLAAAVGQSQLVATARCYTVAKIFEILTTVLRSKDIRQCVSLRLLHLGNDPSASNICIQLSETFGHIGLNKEVHCMEIGVINDNLCKRLSF